MMARLLLAEFRKLNASLALLLAVVSPALLGALILLGIVAHERTASWGQLFGEVTLTLWVFFLLPMIVTAFTALVAQIEYRGRAWDHLLALPVRRWQVFTAKALVVMAAVAAMTVLAFTFSAAGGWLGGVLSGRMPTGAIPWRDIGEGLLLVTASAQLFVMLQLWVALRFAHFVVPLAFGIGATLVSLAVMVTGSDKADWHPWLLPLKTIQAEDPTAYLLAGGGGGLLALALMVFDLSRREMR